MPPLSKMKLGFQSILQYLGEIQVHFQGYGIPKSFEFAVKLMEFIGDGSGIG